MTGHVYIIGQIGSDKNSKGVELQEVVQQLEPLKEYDEILVHINSPGGYVQTGEAIANYIGSFPNVKTIAEQYCASISTIIHLAVPVQNRLIEEGCEYMVHNPLLADVSGNADELIAMADSIKPIQDAMQKAYVKATGMSKEAVEGLMKQETTLTSEQAISLGFASQVVPKVQMRAVAMSLISNNLNKNKMADEKSFLEKVKALFTEKGIEFPEKVVHVDSAKMISIKGKEAKALLLPSDGGTLETPFVDLMVGDPVLIDGAVAPAGTYKLEDGTEIVVDENGNVAEINNASAMIESLTVANGNLTTEVDTLKAEIEAKNNEIATLKAEQETVMSHLKSIGGDFVPNVKMHSPQKPKVDEPAKSLKDLMEERKAVYTKKK